MRTTWETPEPDEIQFLDEAHWRLALHALKVPELDTGDERPDRLAQPVSNRLPYARPMDRYTQHVAGCPECSDGLVYSGCENGDDLACRAAAAMSLMEEQAGWN